MNAFTDNFSNISVNLKGRDICLDFIFLIIYLSIIKNILYRTEEYKTISNKTNNVDKAEEIYSVVDELDEFDDDIQDEEVMDRNEEIVFIEY